MRFLFTLFWLLRKSSRRKSINKKKPTTKIKTWKTELPIFNKKMNIYMKTLKFTKSPQVMIKIFSGIKDEFSKIIAYKPIYYMFEFDGENINCIEDLNKINIIQNRYIKDSLIQQINIELGKSEEVNQKFLKEGLIRKALNIALKSVEYLPQDVEMNLKIMELEDKLIHCFEKG